ncbi:OmpA family protein [Sphingomonas sp. SFZ2018-12]|uniref:OmpA family protein n=1 Tax=Sphingomonas sp. SFZ2018-12 TaxID=2683197 RepID=UPI001F0FFB05|nr:OmpA family protein [Sphingomonas sp. SFZ2018-12]MCH4892201.1 OmpA family protein [Sphingomonas sp. SFZ2018-12]
MARLSRNMALYAVLGVGMGMGAPPAHAQTSVNTPDQIVCQLSGVCGDAPADPGAQIEIGDEKAFSLAKPNAAKPASSATSTSAPSRPPAASAAAPSRRPVATAGARTPTRRPAPPTTSGGIDMMVTFALGSADLTDQARAEVRAFAKALESPVLAGQKFRIEGHTDAIGAADYNLDLSRRRAEAVAAYLTSLGVDPGRIETRGFGYQRPRPGTTPRAAVNRRVEFAKAS